MPTWKSDIANNWHAENAGHRNEGHIRQHTTAKVLFSWRVSHGATSEILGTHTTEISGYAASFEEATARAEAALRVFS